MAPEEEVTRGQQAQRILGDTIYQEAYDAVRDRIVAMLESADIPADKRARLNDLLVCHKRVRAYMETVLQSGRLAADNIERDRSFAERVKSRFA